MNRRNLALAAGSALLGGALAVLSGRLGSAETTGALSAPVRWLGSGLRALSLSGFWGNLAAWLLVLLVCAVPVLLVLWCGRWKGGWKAEDWLAVLMAPILFAVLFYAVNPTLLARPQDTLFPLAAGGCLLSLLVAWLALTLLGGMEGCSQQQLLGALGPLLVGGAVVLSFGAAAGQLAEFMARSQAVFQGNTGDPEGAFVTCAILLVLALLELTPYLLGAISLLWGAELIRRMRQDLFGGAAVELCGRTAQGCRFVVQATVLISVFTNLTQLCLMGLMKDTHFSVYIPLFPLLLAGALFLLCRLMEKGRALQEDSDSII